MKKLSAGISLAAARRILAQAFRDAGLPSPDLDARLLVGHALDLDHAALASNSEHPLSAAEAAAVAMFAARRLAFEPVARIRGHKEFWGLDFAVTAATLVPRPDTETVVETALAAVSDRAAPWRVADFGTGTGALLLALLSELPQASGTGTDVSGAALSVARSNSSRLGLDLRAHFVACDYGAALAVGFDLVVSNPPYIASREIPGLDPDVRDYDPGLALDGGEDGLDGYRAVLADAGRILQPGGIVVVELGAGQASAVTALMRAAGFAPDSPKADLSGHLRALLGRRAMRG